MHEFIPVNEPLLDGNEKKYVMECLDTGWISSEGPFIKQFEDGMACYVGRKYAVAVSSGTAALEAAMQALEIEKGAEVILPAFTIISCAQAITKAGLIPVVVDCEKDTWNMDISKIEEKITSKTKAIMVVHIYGMTVDMDPIFALADKYGLQIIEDAAEAHGQEYKGRKCGSLGNISIFSFYPNKHVTCGEGGMILTDDEILAKRCRGIRNLCFMPNKRFVHEEIGSNFRMTNMQAAIGVAQLERIEEFIVRKREMGKYYKELLADVKSLQFQADKSPYCDNIYWVFGLVIKEDIPFNAEYAMKFLADRKIGTRPFFYPLHKQPILQKMGFFQNESCPNAERIAERGFYIPSGLKLEKNEMKIVVAQIKELFKK